MSWTRQEHLVCMLWVLLGAVTVIVGIYLIGHAVHDADELGHKQQLECIAAGGNMNRAPNSSGSLICSKS